MVAGKPTMKDELEMLNKKTAQIREQFEKCYICGNETSDFKERFIQKQNDVEQLFIIISKEMDIKRVAKLLADVSKELQSLEQLFNVSNMFVAPEVHRMCDDLIWSFEDRLTLLKKNHMVQKRLKEVEKLPTTLSVVSPQQQQPQQQQPQQQQQQHQQQQQMMMKQNNNNITTNNENKSNINNNNITTNLNNNIFSTKFITKTEKRPTKTYGNNNEDIYTLADLNGVALTLSGRVIKSKQVLLTGLISCVVKISCPLDSIQILYCKYCQIHIYGQVVLTIVKCTQNSTIIVNGDKIRMEYCENTLFKIPIKSNATVKECYNLEFAPYDLNNENNKKETTTSSSILVDTKIDNTDNDKENKLNFPECMDKKYDLTNGPSSSVTEINGNPFMLEYMDCLDSTIHSQQFESMNDNH